MDVIFIQKGYSHVLRNFTRADIAVLEIRVHHVSIPPHRQFVILQSGVITLTWFLLTIGDMMLYMLCTS